MSVEHLVSFQTKQILDGDLCHSCHLPNGGRITVVDRMTGFGYRDIETGYRSPCGQFWLASGGYDIRDYLNELEDHDAMERWVIERANVCTGGHYDKPYSRLYPECVA